jgi:hypothetical protein
MVLSAHVSALNTGDNESINNAFGRCGMRGLKIGGCVWLLAVVALVVYLMFPALQDVRKFQGPAGLEYLFPPLFVGLLFSLPGLLLLLIGMFGKRRGLIEE